MLETLDHTIRIGSTPTFQLYFDLYLYSAYAAYYVYSYLITYTTICGWGYLLEDRVKSWSEIRWFKIFS